MPEGEQHPKRKLRVVDYDQMARTQKGAPIYKVRAVREDGSPVEEELRSFQELPIGDLLEYELQRYDHPQYGISWTLIPPKDKLNTRVRKLEERVQALEEQLASLMSGTTGGPSGATEDDIPF